MALRRAASSALTGPLPVAISWKASPPAWPRTIACVDRRSSSRASSTMTSHSSTWNQSCRHPVACRMSSSSDPSATSKWYPSCSSCFSVSTISLSWGPSSSMPSSFAFIARLLRPASSDTTTCVRLPTSSGRTCSYASGLRAIALAWMPPLCANADEPTYAACALSAMFTSSATWWATGVRRSSRSGGIVSIPIFSVRFGMIAVRLQLPVRSPYPLIVPCTWVAPPRTPASALATPVPASSWRWTATATSPPK